MKRKALFLLGIIVIGILCSAFENKDETHPVKYDYAVMVGSTKIGMGDQVNTQQLVKLLGKPVSEKTQIIKDDTYAAGVTYKTHVYDGLTLELWKGDNEDYYINGITVSNENFPMASGVKVGDTLDRLKEVYPVEQIPPSANASVDVYEFSEGEIGGCTMQFEISEHKIIKFTLSQSWD